MRVLVVADDAPARAELAVRLAEYAGCVVVGQVGSDLESAEAYHADALLWDFPKSMDSGGIPDDLADAPAPVVAMVSDEAAAAAAMASGARGCLLGGSDMQIVVAALQAVAAGLVVTDPALPLAPRAREGDADPPAEDLTARELAVLQLLAEGLPNKAIAQRLGVSEHTVKFHVNAVFSKLGAHTRTEAATRAARLGLIVL